jgi:hypothetical protein
MPLGARAFVCRATDSHSNKLWCALRLLAGERAIGPRKQAPVGKPVPQIKSSDAPHYPPIYDISIFDFVAVPDERLSE